MHAVDEGDQSILISLPRQYPKGETLMRTAGASTLSLLSVGRLPHQLCIDANLLDKFLDGGKQRLCGREIISRGDCEVQRLWLLNARQCIAERRMCSPCASNLRRDTAAHEEGHSLERVRKGGVVLEMEV